MTVNEPMEKHPKPDPDSRLSALIDDDLDRLLKDRPNPGEAPDLRAAVLARVNRDLESGVSRKGFGFGGIFGGLFDGLTSAGSSSLSRGLSGLWPASWAASGALCAMMIWMAVRTETPIVAGADVMPFEDAIVMAMAEDGSLSDSLADPLAEMFGELEGDVQ